MARRLLGRAGAGVALLYLLYLVVMGGVLFIPLGAIVVGLIIKWFDWLYEQGKAESNRRQRKSLSPTGSEPVERAADLIPRA